MQGPADAARPLRIATYNVHGCVGTDGKLDPQRVARVIAQLDAAVVGLQEVDCRQRLEDGRTQLQHLAEATGMHAVPGPTIVEEHGYFGNALLSHLPVAEVRHNDLSVPGREPRGMLEVRLELGAEHLSFVVTHFGLRGRERARQVETLLGHLQDTDPFVLVGDFNEWQPRAATLLKLHTAFEHTPPARSFPSRFPVFALDRIWVMPRRALLDLQAFKSPLARLASDHLPVRAELDRAQLFEMRID